MYLSQVIPTYLANMFVDYTVISNYKDSKVVVGIIYSIHSWLCNAPAAPKLIQGRHCQKLTQDHPMKVNYWISDFKVVCCNLFFHYYYYFYFFFFFLLGIIIFSSTNREKKGFFFFLGCNIIIPIPSCIVRILIFNEKVF